MITQKELKEILNYNSESGIFTWKNIVKPARKKVGDVAGGLCLGYVVIGINGKIYRAHRLAWLYIYGKWPNDQIDHVNGIKNDNRLCNLRECNQSKNNYNRKMQKNNTSGIKGVCKHKDKWMVQFKINKNVMYFGTYDDIEFAELVANEVRAKYHKEFLRN
jgi:hypothetical protein